MNEEERRRLVRLVRQIAREVAYEALDEHLEDCEHKEKPAEDGE